MDKKISEFDSDLIIFYLDETVFFKRPDSGPWIYCTNIYLFSTWKVGDYIEIDTEKTLWLDGSHRFNDTNIVRKVSSAAMVPTSGQMSLSREQAEAFADRLADRVERSGGKYELDAYIQQGTEPHGTPYTRQGWTYRKK